MGAKQKRQLARARHMLRGQQVAFANQEELIQCLEADLDAEKWANGKLRSSLKYTEFDLKQAKARLRSAVMFSSINDSRADDPFHIEVSVRVSAQVFEEQLRGIPQDTALALLNQALNQAVRFLLYSRARPGKGETAWPLGGPL